MSYGSPGSTALVLVSNSGTIATVGNYSPGIIARSYAYGDSTATTKVYNSGSITVSGNGYRTSFGTVAVQGGYLNGGSAGVIATSYASSLGAGAAVATTLVSNSGSITTTGMYSPGVIAYQLL